MNTVFIRQKIVLQSRVRPCSKVMNLRAPFWAAEGAFLFWMRRAPSSARLACRVSLLLPASMSVSQDYHGDSEGSSTPGVDSSGTLSGKSSSTCEPIPSWVIDYLAEPDKTPEPVQPAVPMNSSRNLLYAYYGYGGPPTPQRKSPEPGTVILSKGKTTEVQKDFRKFLKVAARSSVRLKAEELPVDDIQAEYATIMEALGGLRESLRATLPCDEWEWLGTMSTTRLPAPFPEASTATKAVQIGGDTSMLMSQIPALFPLRVIPLPPDSDSLVVPTSVPQEIEYPLMIEMSLECQIEMGMYPCV
ncbi:hypothetical protein C2E23DRAFT_423039 [Lenzites betulinus]|nr:hypothetical protein C2E23DRAFT_423039 [Lenzites betulinus]